MPAGSTAHRGSGQAALTHDLKHAAQLAEASYDAMKDPRTRGRVRKAKLGKSDDVQAFLLRDGTLLVPGSNSALDYLRYNIRPLNIGGRRFRVKSKASGKVLDQTWHQGFMAHAMAIEAIFRADKPRFLIGHSLGAASVQLLSLIWGVPSIGFAAPRIYAGRAMAGGHHLSLSIVRDDDPVTLLPPGFAHAGRAVKLDKGRSLLSPRHKVRHYIADLDDPSFADRLPRRWPG
ncbi:MAG: hypothetical protein GVY31_06655 [Alphaproteobacteria bacterium]|jgi:hypothetical protein|nr:hypothetical protein [Alphaproteobacteria bacterium]